MEQAQLTGTLGPLVELVAMVKVIKNSSCHGEGSWWRFMVASRSEHRSSCILPTALRHSCQEWWCRCDSTRWAGQTRATCALTRSGVHWGAAQALARPSFLQLQAVGMQPPALRTGWPITIETHPASDWSKINVITLPHFLMQRQQKSGFLRSPATSLRYNSTGWFPSGVLGSPFPAAQDSLENESWILIRQPLASNINLVIL